MSLSAKACRRLYTLKAEICKELRDLEVEVHRKKGTFGRKGASKETAIPICNFY